MTNPGAHAAAQNRSGRAATRTGRSALFFVVATAALVALSVLGAAPAQMLRPAPQKTDPKTAAADSRTVVGPAERAHQVIVYYFHTTYRCPTCRTLEAYSREAIETAFADSLKRGTLIFKVVNIDERDNRHFVTDYKLYTKSLVLVNVVKGRTGEWKNLEKIWELVPDRTSYLKYVQSEVRGYLRGRP